ncbi:hypothetical protein ACHAW6_009028 [Cyclotella cf. meneghiniana]
MAVGSELAALLEARRRKNEADENSRTSNDNDDADNAASSRNDAATRRNGPSVASGGNALWIKNKAASNETTSDTPVKQAASSKPATNGPSTSHAANLKSAAASTTNDDKLAHVPSTQHATVTRNPKLQQRMDKANLEAGIPTPDFLVEMRKNLKSNSEKRGGEITVGGNDRLGRQAAAEKSLVARGSVANGNANDEFTRSNTLKEEPTGEDTARQQSLEEPSIISKRPTNVDMGKHDEREANSATASANSAKLSSQTTYSSTTKSASVTTSPRPNVDLAARRSRLVAHRHASNTTQTAMGEKNDDNNNSNHNNNQSGESGINSATAKISPNKERILNSPQNNSNDDRNSSSSGSSITHNEGRSANVRRERILAKVRANTTLHKTHKAESRTIHGSNSISSNNSGVGLEDTVGLDKKIKVTSPHAEEVEMFFADEGFVTSGSCSNEEEQQQQQQYRQHKELMATASGKNKQSSSLAMAALAAKKNQSHILADQDSSHQHASALHSPGSLDETPQKAKSYNGRRLQIHHQRLHMASTPKIRGNCQHRRDLFDEDKEEEKQNQPQHPISKGGLQHLHESIEEESDRQDQWNPIMETQRRNSINNGLPCQPSPQSQHQCLRNPEDDKIHSIHQAYSLNERAPSTISAISGISIPSCFPQDSPFGHLQQPLLVGGSSGFNGTYGGSSQVVSNTPIKESTSFPSAASNVSGGINLGLLNNPNFASNSSPQAVGGLGTSAFSSGVENENRRLREQIGSMQKKLDEKDAIISQLMKRIGDLENSTRANDADKSSHSGASNSYSMDPDAYAMSSLWERSRPASDIAYTPYADAESISMSPSPHHQHSNIVKQSPSTTHTSSTASLTTATSGKSQSHQRQSSSKSLPGQQSPVGLMGRMKRSPHRRGNASIGIPNTGDDRRFQC